MPLSSVLLGEQFSSSIRLRGFRKLGSLETLHPPETYCPNYDEDCYKQGDCHTRHLWIGFRKFLWILMRMGCPMFRAFAF